MSFEVKDIIIPLAIVIAWRLILGLFSATLVASPELDEPTILGSIGQFFLGTIPGAPDWVNVVVGTISAILEGWLIVAVLQLLRSLLLG